MVVIGLLAMWMLGELIHGCIVNDSNCFDQDQDDEDDDSWDRDGF
jgi:hypothetical protein